MVRKSLLVATFLVVASPLAAQEELVWSPSRSDAQIPLGIQAGRTLEMGQFELTYRFSQMNSKGVYYQSDSLGLDQTLEFYPVAPLALENLTHEVTLGYAPNDDFTVTATMGYSQRHREQFTDQGRFYVTEADELGDLEITGLYNVFRQGPHRAHLQLGALIPTGTSEVTAETPFSSPGAEALPYDMRPGSGTFGVMPGLTYATQNEVATVGAQVKGLLRFGTNSLDYTLGNRYDGNAWASYRATEYVAVSARAHLVKWNGIKGADPDLDPARDPGNEAYFGSGRRLDIPVGLSISMPEGARFAGHRLAVEWIFPVHQKYDGPSLGADWGVVAGWQVVF